MTIARILSIAGSDSGGGAGIQADVRVISALGGHAMTAITAITAQNSLGVSAVKILDADMVIAQAQITVDDFGVDAIKIGMLGSADIANAVAQLLEQFAHIPVIFDPVMVASSGDMLADDETIAAFDKIMRHSTLVTPNIPEYERLVETIDDFPCDVLLKGGHGKDDILIDTLFSKKATLSKKPMKWQDKRIDTLHNHGTGCTLSAAIATFMGQGMGMRDAITHARQFVRASLACAPQIGSANGPMGVPRGLNL